MTMMDILVGAIIAGMVGAAVWYLFRNKKKGALCRCLAVRCRGLRQQERVAESISD